MPLPSPSAWVLLAEIDREIANTPTLAANYYARGWLLSHLGRREESVAAYDTLKPIVAKVIEERFAATAE